MIGKIEPGSVNLDEIDCVVSLGGEWCGDPIDAGENLSDTDYEVKYRHKEILFQSSMKKHPEGLKKEGGLIGEKERRMIGSTAPACTFNECKGCRFKCSAEQVPVDANDPMNSAYRYKCLCHR
ncbi:EPIDERMAL PATTERNING FACTOR-like protein 9 [Carex littledalei]|uniref:EPIDERMAL PATTERNING FACTOR-like protein 9 n=1 Tax=Carex littledalei TaxID=544730 RepID=A0A833R996_9POAL|nr:EPIDERMAL PATTERNING FACTOR-like protein 9 [Carex littledalei]